MSSSSCNRWGALLLTISRCLAVAPTARKGFARWIHCLWCVVLLGYVWTGCIWKCVVFDAEMPTIEKLLFLMEFPGNITITGLLVYHAVLNSPYAKEVETQIHRLICEQDVAVAQRIYQQHGKRTRLLLVYTIVFHGVCVVVDIVNYKFNWWTTWISNSVFNLPALMISLGVLQYALAVHFLWLLQAHLCHRLAELQMRQRPPKGIVNLDARYDLFFAALVDAGGCSSQVLEELRSTYTAIDRQHRQLLDKFGPFLLLNFGNSLCSFCLELYMVFNFFEQPQWAAGMLLFYRLLWLVMHGGRIWIILAVNEQLVEQECHLCLQLNQLEVCGSHLERTINRFLVQLQTSIGQPLLACGVIDLDTLAMGGFIGVLMAIVIFLIQIGLGNKSLMGVALNQSSWIYV
ncbi:putative gustatory receptor 59e [Drosophila subobscura]|uniref:putative gustatory receptor 59e n=1 Tax=Drosophila subobscura TaxID=7241 RepID=UPI00155A2B89|nr:putative gustatory receptor 59e [Drosophila subobscura]